MFRRRSGDVACLVLLAFLVRLLLWWWVVDHDVAPAYDEVSYLSQAEGWGDLLRSFSGATDIDPDEAWERAIGDGRWPPLHAISLGVILSLGGDLGALRFLGVFLGALTTSFLFALTRRLYTRRAARFAAGIHALAPAFLFYSHTLWSESLTLALALPALILAIESRRRLLRDRPGARRRILAAGALLGGVALCRVALLPWALGVAIWLAATPILEAWSRRSPRRRDSVEKGRVGRFLIAGALSLGSTLIVLLPWLVVEAKAFHHVGLSTLNGYNFALGNHPRIPAGYGSSWGHAESSSWLRNELERRGAEVGVEWHEVAGELAWEEVRRDPLDALARAPIRLWLLWAPDVLPIRHLVHTDYPPLGAGLAILAIVWILMVHLFTAAGGVAGLLMTRARRAPGLIPILIVLSLVPPALSLSATRFHLPLELLMLPGLGALLTGFRRRRGDDTSSLRLPRLGQAAALAMLVASLAALPRTAELYWCPSAATSSWLDPWLRPMGVDLLYSDLFLLQRPRLPDGQRPEAAARRWKIVVRDAGIGWQVRLAPRPWIGLSDDPDERPWPLLLEADKENPALENYEFELIWSKADPISAPLGADAWSSLEGGLATLEIHDLNGGVVASWEIGPGETLAWRRGVSQGDLMLTWLGGGRSPR